MKIIAALLLAVCLVSTVEAHPCNDGTPRKDERRYGAGRLHPVAKNVQLGTRRSAVRQIPLQQTGASRISRRDCDHGTRNAVLIAAGAVGVGFLIHSLNDDDCVVVYQPAPHQTPPPPKPRCDK